MKFVETKISGAYLIDLDLNQDDRGFFARYFCEKEFANFNLNTHWVQINNSMSTEIATLRGMHFQTPPYAEVKVVRCIKGAVWDVIVDLRHGSKTYGQWFGAELNEINRTMMYVPKGCAHGFLTLKPNSEIIYLVSEFYESSAEKILLWNDSSVSIDWPLKPEIISAKDKSGKSLNEIVALKK